MNKTIYQKIQSMREHFGWDETDTVEFMVKALHEESQELVESLDEDEASFQKELADVLMYAFAICIDKNYDIEALISNKIDEVMKREY